MNRNRKIQKRSQYTLKITEGKPNEIKHFVHYFGKVGNDLAKPSVIHSIQISVKKRYQNSFYLQYCDESEDSDQIFEITN